LFVSPSKQIWKCFGCGAGGDVIKFVSLYENIPYIEAAAELAKRFKINIDIGSKDRDSKVYTALEEVANFYHSQIGDEKASDYIRSRGIGASTVKRFQLGYSPGSTSVVRFLSSVKLLEEYKKTKNLVEVGGDTLKDLFSRRIIFPIRDYTGRVVGFGAGATDGSQPKYINSPESEVFQKRRVLFGLHQSINYLREFREAIVVEGYFDVLRMHEAGFRNTVAPLGTSLTREQAQLLARFVKRVYLMFDGDSAGQRALRGAIPHILSSGMEVYTVELPEGLDPDDVISRYGKERIKTLLNGSKELFLSLLEKVIGAEDKTSILRDFTYYASFLQDEVRAYSLLLEMSRLTNIPISVLGSQMQRPVSDSESESKPMLSPPERIFLKGLIELKPKGIDLNSLDLSPNAYVIAEKILAGEEVDIPEEVIGMKVGNLEEAFEYAVKEELALKIDNVVPASKDELRRLVNRGGNRFRRRFRV
jgi:DNA primase